MDKQTGIYKHTHTYTHVYTNIPNVVQILLGSDGLGSCMDEVEVLVQLIIRTSCFRGKSLKLLKIHLLALCHVPTCTLPKCTSSLLSAQ